MLTVYVFQNGQPHRVAECVDPTDANDVAINKAASFGFSLVTSSSGSAAYCVDKHTGAVGTIGNLPELEGALSDLLALSDDIDT